MSFNYCFTFSAVEISVRYGDCSTHNTDIISCYVHLGLERAKQLQNIEAVRHAHMRVLNTLIDTMCDHCIALAWREQCYRYIKRLLPLLHEMLDQQQYQKKLNEIQSLHAYYFGKSHTKSPSVKFENNQLSSARKQR